MQGRPPSPLIHPAAAAAHPEGNAPHLTPARLFSSSNTARHLSQVVLSAEAYMSLGSNSQVTQQQLARPTRKTGTQETSGGPKVVARQPALTTNQKWTVRMGATRGETHLDRRPHTLAGVWVTTKVPTKCHTPLAAAGCDHPAKRQRAATTPSTPVTRCLPCTSCT